MKTQPFSIPKWSPFFTFAVTAAIFGLSCGSGTNSVPLPVPEVPVSYVDSVCGAPIFRIGRPLSMSALATAEAMSFELREVHFRDVILRGPDEIEFAYRTKMHMNVRQIPTDARRTYLVPGHSLECDEKNQPSRGSLRLARTMIPIVGDLHLPSLQVTASTTAYSVPRISEMTVSNGSYFSFNNQNWGRYGQIRSIGDYMNILRYRSLFNVVELREMGEGWLGIYAEKNANAGGRERAQLMILLARTY